MMTRLCQTLAIMLGLSIVLVGCGSTTTGRATATPTATAAATVTPSPIPPATVTYEQFHAACPSSNGQGNALGRTYQFGDLYVAISLTNVSYPAAKLPDGTPFNPFKLPNPNSELGGLSATPEVNPDIARTGVFIEVCNAAAIASHRIEGVDARIDRFVPFTGALNSWQFCAGWYANGHADGGGCGGGYQAGELLQAAFSANASAGATTTANFVKAGQDLDGAPLPPLPLTRKSGQSVLMVASLTPPTAPGTYTFSFSLTIDGAKTPFAPLADDLLLDPAARTWSGDACATPTMQAQIPSGSADSYICPDAA
jgi:hypothetical protein